jgi:hypothetical protein
MSILDSATQIIDTSSGLAITLSQDAQQQADRAVATATSWLNDSDKYIPPVVVAPVAPMATQLSDPTGKVEAAFDRTYAMFTADYQAQVSDFVLTYFPQVSSTLADNSDAWLNNALVNGGSGLPIDVENALWQRDRDRVVTAAIEAERTVVSEYASRGFSMPGGVLDNKVADIRLQASRQLAESSRTAATTNADWVLKNTQFAVEQTIKLRIGAMEALAAFLHAYAGIYSAAVDYSKVILECQSALWTASIQYYSSQVSYAGVATHGSEVDVSSQAQINSSAIGYIGESAKARASAAVGAAEALGRVASAALAAQHTNVSLSSSEQL